MCFDGGINLLFHKPRFLRRFLVRIAKEVETLSLFCNIRAGVPQAAELQHIGNQIDAAMILTASGAALV